MNILCVDDDPIILKFFKDSFEKIGLPDYALTTTMTGTEALDIVTKQHIDLVILDIKLPDISGIETLHGLKKVKPQTEVMIVTGYASIETAVEAMKAGARDFISKPFHFALLREKVLNIFELLQREREAEDYRFAKEVIETEAHHEITLLEEATGTMKQCLTDVLEILDSTRSDVEKVAVIRQKINGFGRTSS